MTSSESPTHPDAPRAGGETPDLLPCPFCGETRVRAYCTGGWWCIRCTQRKCQAHAYPFAETEADAVAAWNRRASLLERHRDGERAEIGLPPDESPQRNAVCDALTEALLYLGNLAYEADERTVLDLRDEGDMRGLARLLTVRDAKGRDGSLGENTRNLWARIGKALVSAPPSPERASK